MAHTERTIADNYDISGGDKDFDSGTIKDEKLVTAQLKWSGLTGVLDGVVKIQGSNDEVIFDDLGPSHTLDSANGSQSLQDINFGHKFFRAELKVVGLTGGNITIKLQGK